MCVSGVSVREFEGKENLMGWVGRGVKARMMTHYLDSDLELKQATLRFAEGGNTPTC